MTFTLDIDFCSGFKCADNEANPYSLLYTCVDVHAGHFPMLPLLYIIHSIHIMYKDNLLASGIILVLK